MASGVLGNEAIYKAHRAKQIVIEPFDHENLAPCAYDFRLGRYFYRQVQARKDLPANGGLAVDLWDEADARLLWEEAPEVADNNGTIVLDPGEMILGHTEEFIGTAPDSGLTSMIKARSSLGRNGISICMCAGWGDVGFYNRLTLEIKNHTQWPIALRVGKRVGQVVFLKVEGCTKNYSGKYQPAGTGRPATRPPG